jgi:hypothetical protein
MIDFKLAKNIIIASHITGVYDVNRNEILANDDFSIVSKWAKSISDLNLQGIIFHNNFSDETCNDHQNDAIRFVKIKYDSQYNPNVYRYFLYNEFLKLHSHQFENVFFTDVSDVVVLKNPFVQKLFLDNPMAIFCGDEPEILDNVWMQNHGQHLRRKITDYASYEEKFKNDVLLNCGIFGGSIPIMKTFIKELWSIHEKYNCDNETLFTGDMGAFNYLIRTQYNDNLIYGNPVNTEFKKYTSDSRCWFQHK